KLSVIRGFHAVYGKAGGIREPRRTPFLIPKLEKVEPQSRSGRTYYYSAVFRNAAVLRLLTKKVTQDLRKRRKEPGEPSWVYSRIIDQMDSETRSIVANIREGYGRPTTVEYVQFLGYSKGSLEEFRGDITDLNDDGILKSVPGSSLESIGIRLTPPKNPPNPSYDHLEEVKRIIRELRGEELTFEIFMELVNKTDYLLQHTVEGLRGKIIAEEKKKLKQGLERVWRK
ncbi:four helix bundle protein, partial [Candidatus Parcubacteria bacterium]|nr:four helix bundle protein [Candidatus Parcubacteria bacterium]